MRPGAAVLALALCALLMPGGADAATITVTIGSSDPIDINASTATVADLPGPDGVVSFSEAMIAANNTPGHDTIAFEIPMSDWVFQFAFPGRAVILAFNTFYWRAFEDVTIDGTTQTAFTGDTNPDGAEVVFYNDDFSVPGNSTIRGIDSSSFALAGSNGLIEGNTGGCNITIGGGSGNLIQDNVGGTLKIDRSNDNVVIGNTFTRIRVWGFGLSQLATNNRIGGPTPEERNSITGYGSYNSEGLPAGHSIQLFDTQGTIIENNSIGSTPDGLASGNPAANMGIRMEGTNTGTRIRDNRIAGVLGIGQGPHHAGQLFGWAIYMIGTVSDIELTGNTIGLDANGEPLLGSVTGIDLGAFGGLTLSDVRIGGTAPGEGNVIAGHIFNGITVGNQISGVRISGNSIYDNDLLGIELVTTGFDYGVTPNDPMDADAGGNDLQNFPEIATVQQGAMLQVTGSLQSLASSDFTLDFFASPACDPVGFGEGQVYLGSTAVSTDASGDASFDVSLSTFVSEGWVITSTATLEPVGNTSEFSACVPLENVVATPDSEPGVASMVRLEPGHPNPFRTEMTIGYELPQTEAVRLTIHDAAGRLVRVLVDAEGTAGEHRAVWDGHTGAGQRVAPGVYFYKLDVGGRVFTGRVVRGR